MPNVSSVASRVWMIDWHRELQRQRELRAKHVLLHLAWREVVVIVETNLANRHGAFTGNASSDARARVVEASCEISRLVRIEDPDRESDGRPQRPDARRSP